VTWAKFQRPQIVQVFEMQEKKVGILSSDLHRVLYVTRNCLIRGIQRAPVDGQSGSPSPFLTTMRTQPGQTPEPFWETAQTRKQPNQTAPPNTVNPNPCFQIRRPRTLAGDISRFPKRKLVSREITFNLSGHCRAV
jgi:hypothetical protein